MDKIDNPQKQDKMKRLILTLHQDLYNIISKEASTSTGMKPNPRVQIEMKRQESSSKGKIVDRDSIETCYCYINIKIVSVHTD